MAKKKRSNENFELAWQGLVVFPALLGFWIGFRDTHSLKTGIIVAIVAGALGIGIISAFRYVQREKLKRSGILQVDEMNGRDFENYLGHLFRSQGYKVEVTSESGDYGADLVLEKDGTKIVIQAKRYAKNVSIKAVQEVQASIAHYRAHQGWVVTNSKFTDAAIRLARSNNIRLVARNELVKMMLAMKERDGNIDREGKRAF